MAKSLNNLAKRVTEVQIARRVILCGLFCLLLFVPLRLPSQLVVPAEKVLDAVGVKPGMIIGEIGAGSGIFTIPLAVRVGEKGRIYANDIYQPALDNLRERCQKDGLKNIEIILSKVDDPLFPKAAVDMVFIVRTYHHLSQPVALLKNTISSLKPNAIIVIVDPDPVKGTTGRIKLIPSELTPPEKVRREAAEAGFEIADILTFLETHNIFILKVKN
jgi:ubiquinone/menaquinone biosynthesis C-methylase UbiE